MSEVTCICCYQESNMRNMDPDWIKRDVLVCSTCVADPRPLHEINPDAFIDIRATSLSKEIVSSFLEDLNSEGGEE